jgi:N-methylhydantoinase A/oxoprolinase/acetone carboxylase beta subunit
MKRYRVAVDIGGTFVDAVQFNMTDGSVALAKAPTTPTRPAVGVLKAVEELGTPLAEVDIFVHGTTLPLNAIIEHKGAETGIVTNEGFRDIFCLGRTNVPDDHIYDFGYERPASVVKRRNCIGVAGRIDKDGNELVPLDEDAVRGAARQLIANGVKAIAICFLHSYKDPRHEEAAANILEREFPELTVSISTKITREYREYERTATTVLDAYIRSIFKAYVNELSEGLKARGFNGDFLVMRSSGGATSVDLAIRAPIHTVMSGPAGGIVGSVELARAMDRKKVINLDYGGTSLDVSLIENYQPSLLRQTTVGHLAILVPTFDVRSIGAGGGSIVWVQEGLLQVGPRSAGSAPGPMAYARGGTEPTTTDAAIVLGYINPKGFLGGKMVLDRKASLNGIEGIAAQLRMDPIAAAAGALDVITAHTLGAIREITIEHGADPADFSLLAFGGAGPLIAPLIARELEIAELIVPGTPAVFSAKGMLSSDVTAEYSMTNIMPLTKESLERYDAHVEVLGQRVRAELAEQKSSAEKVRLHCTVDCKLKGQGHVLELPYVIGEPIEEIEKRFHELHLIRYGHVIRNVAIELVTLHVNGAGLLSKPQARRIGAASSSVSRALRDHRDAYCFHRRAMVRFSVIDRSALLDGDRLEGPVIIEEETSVTVVHSDQLVEVDSFGNLLVKRSAR